MAKRRRMTAKQLRYFGKRKTRVRTVYVKTKRRHSVMARGRRFRGYAKRGFSGLGGKGMFAPVLGGLADHVISGYIPNINGIGSTAVGVFMHSGTTRDIGLYQLGHSIGNFLPLPGSSGGQGGVL